MLRRTIFTSILSIFMLGLVACSTTDEETEGEAASKSEGTNNGELSDELLIFNWTDYMPDEIIEGFEEEFDVDVTYSTFASNQEMLSKIQSGTVAYDIAVPSDFYVQIMKEQDLLEKINFDNVPNFENISDEWKGLEYDPDDEYSVIYAYGYDGLIYNKDKIEEPKSWEALWNPEYKGHVVAMDAANELNAMVQQYMGNNINKMTEEQIEEGGEKLEGMMPNILKFTEAPKAELVSGEAWLTYGYSGEAAVAKQAGANVGFAFPEEGGIKWTDNMVIPKTTANKATAEAFINYMLRPDVSEKLTEDFPYGNPNEKALEQLDEDILELPGLNEDPEDIENAEWSHVLDSEKAGLVNRAVQEAKINGGAQE